METVFFFVGLGSLVVCVFAMALCKAAALGDDLWAEVGSDGDWLVGEFDDIFPARPDLENAPAARTRPGA